MKASKLALVVGFLLAICVGVSAQDSLQLNKVSLNGGLMFNIRTEFSGTPALSLRPPDLTDPSTLWRYDDGHVKWDGSYDSGIVGKGARITGDWSYDYAAQKHGDFVDMHKVTDWPGTSPTSDNVTSPSFEFLYERIFWLIGDRYPAGLEIGIGLASFDSESNGRSFGAGTRTADTLTPFCPWLDPWKNATAPFQGGPGQDPKLMIDILPPTRVTEAVTVTTLTQDRLGVTLVPMRLGPFVDFPLSKRFNLKASGGLAVAGAFTDYSWSVRQTAGDSSRSLSGSHSQSDLLLGGYGGIQASYNLGKGWSIGAGLQFTGLSSLENQAGGKSTKIDFGKMVGVSAVFGWTF